MTLESASGLSRPRAWRFEGFEVDAQRNILRRAGARVPITPKALEALIHLVRNHGRTVSRTELHEAVWAGSIVEENTVAVTIAALRRALGERPRDARFVITVPGVGYRFVADLESIASEPGTPGPPVVLQPAEPFVGLWRVGGSSPEGAADWRIPFDPGAEVHGLTLGGWMTTWFRYLMERPGTDHPLLSENGDFGDAVVLHGVAFLFGAWTKKANLERTCRVTRGAPIFVPVMGMNIDNFGLAPGQEPMEASQMMALVRSIVDDAENPVLEVDGRAVADLRRFRVGPQRHSYCPGPDSIYERLGVAVPSIVEPAFCDGYVAVLPPPPPGEHIVHFGATYRVSGETWDRRTTYKLYV